ncbi:alpha/beta fold hydrolase [Methyloceanibacter sp.]|uniref:alpha/beta fold hydrolase n=1 Tax=Methyloceanibacter sp. TaxID=1965321 RepID=UPI003D6CE440
MNRPAPKMHFVFVHGWGFNAAIWRDLTGYMRSHAFSLVDLGFIAGGPKAATSEWPSDAIAVGHSLGLLWLLHRAREEGRMPFRGLVSIQGFDRFCPHIPPSRVAFMRRGLRRDAYQTLDAFWRGCATEPFASLEALNVARLDEGLGWLTDWDETKATAGLACPTLALAARDDAIVPQAMSEAIWGGDNIRWSETGGHVLPLRHPEWCASHVLDFAHALQP